MGRILQSVVLCCIFFTFASAYENVDDDRKGVLEVLGVTDDHEQQVKDIITLMCKNSNAEDKAPQVVTAVLTFGECVGGLFNDSTLQREIEEAKGPFSRYCTKSPQLKACIHAVNASATPCLPAEFRDHVAVAVALLDFACLRDGDMIDLFIAEGGPQCFQEKANAFRECRNSHYKSTFASIHAAAALTTAERCSRIDKTAACAVRAMEGCSNPVPANVAEALLKFVRTVTPCNAIPICGLTDHGTAIRYRDIYCPDRAITTSTTTISSRSTTEYVPATSTTVNDDYDVMPPDDCSQLPGLTEPTGIKSWDKCMEYQKQLVYPCEDTVTLVQGQVRVNKCHHKDEKLVAGIFDTERGEFPHMVLLGYGQNNGTAMWQCGGTLISDRFILTAGQCARIRGIGNVSYAIVGAHRRTDEVQPWQMHRIKRIIRHPDFKHRTMHNDIALLEINPIDLNEWTVPACLDVFGGNRSQVEATGWGSSIMFGKPANTLKKVTLTKFSDRECRDHYPVRRDGGTFNSTIETCYGDYIISSDVCQGDGGGPLTIRNPRFHCMYSVVGIISSGIGCGVIGQPAWYTKVSHFVPWIESIVWP